MRKTILTGTACAFLVGVAQVADAAGAQSSQANQVVRIGVFSLFHPTTLRLAPVAGAVLVVDTGGEEPGGQSGSLLLRDQRPLSIRAEDGWVHLDFGDGFERTSGAMAGVVLRAHGQRGYLNQAASRFWLEVPGKLRRQYAGTLEIRARGSLLEAVVIMSLETAVASIVLAESPPGAGAEALKAQAVAARSFLAAHPSSHLDFDFCDTTHCQFLRSPPAAGTHAARAAEATRGLILTWHDNATDQDRTVPAMYARSCGGRTRTLQEIGVPSKGYPFYSVRCVYCSHHPEIWQRQAGVLPQPETAKGTSTTSESERLAYNRIHGWGAIPGISMTLADGSSGTVTGRGIGHGVGLCQLGAASMARHGAGFAQILAHYYPNTRLTTMLEP